MCFFYLIVLNICPIKPNSIYLARLPRRSFQTNHQSTTDDASTRHPLGEPDCTSDLFFYNTHVRTTHVPARL